MLLVLLLLLVLLVLVLLVLVLLVLRVIVGFLLPLLTRVSIRVLLVRIVARPRGLLYGASRRHPSSRHCYRFKTG